MTIFLYFMLSIIAITGIILGLAAFSAYRAIRFAQALDADPGGALHQLQLDMKVVGHRVSRIRGVGEGVSDGRSCFYVQSKRHSDQR